MNLLSEEYLEHFGIKGMEWGKKNGPPYPLDESLSQKIKRGINVGIKTVSARLNKDTQVNNSVTKERTTVTPKTTAVTTSTQKKNLAIIT